MDSILILFLKIARKIYLIFNPESTQFGRNMSMFSNKEYSNNLIYRQLTSNAPCMIARFGAFELNCLVNFLGVKNVKKSKSYKGFITSQKPQWWWEKSLLKHMFLNTGFFPISIGYIEKFCELMIKDMGEVDILGSWRKEESFFLNELINTKRVALEDLDPFFATKPWTLALSGKKVLVIHPFTETIEQQYKKRELLFENNLLPDFELKTIKAVQSIAGEETEFKDWFEALEFMKNQIEHTDFDICIIGAGAYGFPLAAYVKRLGKKAIHLGGVTQLLFGIKGRRWVDYPMLYYPYANLFNEYWTYPLSINKPRGADKVEEACYW